MITTNDCNKEKCGMVEEEGKSAESDGDNGNKGDEGDKDDEEG